MSSGTTAEPIQPDAPVTKTRMRNLHGPNVLGIGCALRQSMSVAAITVAPDVSRCHQVRSGEGSMGAERARPARAGAPRSLRPARAPTGHGGGGRPPGEAHR